MASILAAASFAALLLLRLALPFCGGLLAIHTELAFTVFVNGMYVLAIIHIGARREALDRLHVTRGFLLLFLLLPLAALAFKYAVGGDFIVAWVMPAAWLLMFLLPARGTPRFLHISPIKSLIWLGISIVLGVAGGLLLGLLQRVAPPSGAAIIMPEAAHVLPSFLLRLSVMALCEEPLFRGFLWAWLRERGLGLWAVCLLQAALFALTRLFFPFGGGVPLLLAAFGEGLLLGLVAWKSKSLTYPVLLHVLMEAISTLWYTAG